MERVFGYSLCYIKLAIGVSLIMHCTAAFFTTLAIVTATNMSSEFMRLMRNYHNKQTSKGMVDDIQWTLQCCGSIGYEDWFRLNWAGHQLKMSLHGKYVVSKLLNIVIFKLIAFQ